MLNQLNIEFLMIQIKLKKKIRLFILTAIKTDLAFLKLKFDQGSSKT